MFDVNYYVVVNKSKKIGREHTVHLKYNDADFIKRWKNNLSLSSKEKFIMCKVNSKFSYQFYLVVVETNNEYKCKIFQIQSEASLYCDKWNRKKALVHFSSHKNKTSSLIKLYWVLKYSIKIPKFVGFIIAKHLIGANTDIDDSE